ncbi:efflux RND transporter periplasmic adaptor subunit [bacterium]|nr:efflux RND transporter periplasmic adaptor subunit [bacterium]
MTRPEPAPSRAGGARWRRAPRQWVALTALAASAAGIAFWLHRPGVDDAAMSAAADGSGEVRVVAPRRIAVAPGSPLADKLEIRTVAAERLAAPRLTVSGSIVARLGGGADNREARWDFSQPELAAAYADWLRARTEEPYAAAQLAKTRQLVAARVSAQTAVVTRLRQLVQAGTDAPKDLAAAEADLVQTQLEGQKQVFEAEAAWKDAVRARATLQRQLFQQGVDPELLDRASDDTAILVADVPEARMEAVHVGQAAEARFFARPGAPVPAAVSSVAPALASDRRTLRVFFALDDRGARLRPGMFADVGLGTEARDAISVPSDAVLHIGRSDYILVQEAGGVWRVTPVGVGESYGPAVEVVSGLAPGDVIIGGGAILLKPLMVQALRD